jgi:hypothetical protein
MEHLVETLKAEGNDNSFEQDNIPFAIGKTENAEKQESGMAIFKRIVHF